MNIVISFGITVAHVALPLKRLNDTRLTQVEASATTIPASCNPINAIKRPIPAVIAILTHIGIALNNFARTPVIVKIINNTPSNNTSTSALAYERPKVKHTVYTKNALSPIPGASTNG